MDSNMDFTMHQPNQHHPSYHSSAASSGSASRCPALRAAAEQRNYQVPATTPSRGAVQYEPIHSYHNQNAWESRSSHTLRPGMVSSPHPLEHPYLGAYASTIPSNQPSQAEQHCPLSSVPSHQQNDTEPYPFQNGNFRSTMLPVPRITRPQYPGPGGYMNSNSSQSNGPQQYPGRPIHREDPGLPASASMSTSQGPTTILPIPFSHESRRLGQTGALPTIPHILGRQQHLPSYSQQTDSAEQNDSRQGSFSPPPVTSPQHSNDQTPRILNPIEIRRASTAAMNRARRSAPRFTATPSEWMGDNTIFLRRGDMNLMEFVEAYPGGFSDGEPPLSGHRFLRGVPGTGKKVASKQALASLQSVDVSELPESERTCVICYNDFGVENPEGINEAPLRLPKCKHVFGDHCIKKWFQESDSCPYCRDQVHSELAIIPGRRAHPNLRFLTPYHISAQHLPGLQGYDQHQAHDHEASDPEISIQAEQALSDQATDGSSILSDTGSGNRQLSGRRYENNHYAMRMPSWNATHERRSPPTEYDRRRRQRHRVRVSPSSTRASILAGPSSNGVSQTSQYNWNDTPSPNPNYRGATSTSGPSGAPVFEPSSFAFQSQTSMASDDYFRDFIPPNLPDLPSTNEQSSGSQRTRSRDGRYTSPANGAPDIYAANPGQASSNQFTSYQQS
ncbi:hypothetical protein GGR50DRAFT_241079 [Xylaria sp. CBS 124048]|nr:hypothetical protein GGR50DRAFT_241079 [Xylaria sp. CBS 124048]